MCLQEIDRRARACPHCGHWQWRWQVQALLFVVVPCVALVGYAAWLERRSDRHDGIEQTVAYRGQIAVLQSEMFKGTSADGDVVFVVGKLRNESDVEWEDVEIEAEFLDPQGRLIDVEVEERYFEHLVPHGEMAFKVRLIADRPVEEYADHKVFVGRAEDSRRTPW
jgi:hypothetical protein